MTFTKERIEQFINKPLEHGLTRGEQMEMARIALASLEAEAVGFIARHKETGKFGSYLHPKADWFKSDEYEVLSAYTAPPAPVSVPDGLRLALSNAGIAAPESDEMLAATCEKHIQALVTWVKDRKPFQPAPASVPISFEEWSRKCDLQIQLCDPQFREKAQYIWNDCRAAMLQGAEPVSMDYTLPLDYLQGQKDGLEWAARMAEANHPETGDWLYDDPLELAKAIRKGTDMPVEPVQEWIPCSERMPERDYVLAADFSGAYYLPSLPNTQVGIYADWFEDGKPSWDDGDGNDLHLKQVTHWMPLPAAPQQEANNG